MDKRRQDEWVQRCVAEVMVPKLLHVAYPLHIIACYGAFFTEEFTPEAKFNGSVQPPRKRPVCAMIFEKCVGTLQQWLAFNEAFYHCKQLYIPMQLKWTVVYHIAAAVEVIQMRCGISHSDIKLNNFLVDADGNVKLADFGCVCRLANSDKHAVLIPTGDLNKSKVRVWNRKFPHMTELTRTPRVTEHADQHAMILCAVAVLYGSKSQIVQVAKARRTIVASSHHNRDPCEREVNKYFRGFLHLALSVISAEKQKILNMDKFLYQCRKAVVGAGGAGGGDDGNLVPPPLAARGIPVEGWKVALDF